MSPTIHIRTADMDSLTPRKRSLSRHRLAEDLQLGDIELGELSTRHDCESSIPLLANPYEGSDEAGSPSKVTRKSIRTSSPHISSCLPPWLRQKLRWLSSHILMLLGCYQALQISWSLLDGLCPDDATSVRAAFGLDMRYHRDAFSVAHATTPIACHSHNDYWRVRPFYTAIEIGCSSVEADVWLSSDGDLLIGHRKFSVSRDHTLRNMYLKPILAFLDGRNPALKGQEYAESGERIGIFEYDPEQTLVLLVDFKADGQDIYPILHAQLEPLRRKKYLTYFDGSTLAPGPITVVATGDVDFEDIVRNTTYRDIFYDAPLDVMGGKSPARLDLDYSEDSIYPYDPAVPSPEEEDKTTLNTRSHRPQNPSIYSPINSYYASVSFSHSIGHPWHSSLSHAQIETIRSQIHGAHARGLKVRYWGVPSWPLGLRNYLWRVLVREGADVLSVDDLEAVALQDWGPRKGGWNRKWWP